MSTPTPKSVSITFTVEEARVALNLFDAAVKAIGLNAAEAAFVLARKFTTALKESETDVV